MELNFKIKDNTNKSFNQRKTNLSIFKKKGFPNKREEDWKFTDLEKVLNDNFKELNNEKSENQRSNFHNLKFNHNSITLINGKLETFNFKPENFKDENSNLIKELDFDHHLNFANEFNDNPMQNLNTALHEGGFSLNIDTDHKFKFPIIIYNYFSGNLKNKIINNSEIINMSKNSNATIIEYLIDDSEGCFFKNTFKTIEIVVIK